MDETPGGIREDYRPGVDESIAEVPMTLFKEDDSAMDKDAFEDGDVNERKRSPS